LASVNTPPTATPETEASATRDMTHAIAMLRGDMWVEWQEVLRKLGDNTAVDVSKLRDTSASLRAWSLRRRLAMSLGRRPWRLAWNVDMDSTKRKRRKKMKKHQLRKRRRRLKEARVNRGKD